MDPWELYWVAYYFTVSTATTVGYGDVYAIHTSERILCIFMTIGGVLIFSLTSGALSSILTSFDASNEQIAAKLKVLEKLDVKYNLDPRLKMKLKAMI